VYWCRLSCSRMPELTRKLAEHLCCRRSGGKRDSKVLALSNGGCSPQCVKRFGIGLGLDKRGGYCVHRPDRPPARPRPPRQATQSMTRRRTTRRRKRRAWRWSRHSDFVIPSNFVIRHSDLRNTFCSIQKAGQPTRESGLEVGYRPRGASGYHHRRTADRPGPQRLIRRKDSGIVQNPSTERRAAGGDRPRSGGCVKMRPRPRSVHASPRHALGLCLGWPRAGAFNTEQDSHARR